ncbi:MAG: hypothetical protein R3195_05560 [Gemmatimonadota bacterium]|nr:hypothetical protein [Gemmatimonadota bacterium]
MDREQAARLVRHGSNAGFVVAGLGAVAALIAIFLRPEQFVARGFDGWLSVDAAIVAFMAWQIRRGSRIAAVTLLLYCLADRVALGLIEGRVAGVGVGLIFASFFYNAARGAFALRRLRTSEDAGYRAPARWKTIAGCGASVLLLGTVAIGLLGEVAVVPPTGLVTGEELPTWLRPLLVSEGMIDPDEEILLFYSAALFDFRKDGNALTDRRVLSYEEGDGQLWYASLTFDEIAGIRVADPGGVLEDAVVEVLDSEGDSFFLWIPLEGDGLNRFMRAVEERTVVAAANEAAVRALERATPE